MLCGVIIIFTANILALKIYIGDATDTLFIICDVLKKLKYFKSQKTTRVTFDLPFQLGLKARVAFYFCCCY